MKKLLFSICIILVFNISISASINTTDMFKEDFKVTLEWLEQKPKSTAKDFFILQYLEQDDISIEDAKIAYDMANESNSVVKKAYNKKFKTTISTIKDLKKEIMIEKHEIEVIEDKIFELKKQSLNKLKDNFTSFFDDLNVC